MGASSLSFRERPPGATPLEALRLLPGPVPRAYSPADPGATDAQPAGLTYQLTLRFPAIRCPRPRRHRPGGSRPARGTCPRGSYALRGRDGGKAHKTPETTKARVK